VYEMIRHEGWRSGAALHLATPSILSAAALIGGAFLIGAGCGDGHGGAPATPTFGPIGTITASTRLAFIGKDANLMLINADGSGAESITAGGGVQGYFWSSDGSLIAVERQLGEESSVEVIRPTGESVFEVAGAAAPTWSPRDTRLLVERDGGLDLLDEGGKSIRSIPSAVLPDWKSDGAAIAFIRTTVDGKGIPTIVIVDSGEELVIDPAIRPDEAIYPVLWHPGGAALAFRNTLYDLVSSEKTDLPGPVASFSPDGRLVLVVLGPDPVASGRPAELLDLTQQGKKIIGLEVRPPPGESPPARYIERWMEWSKDGRVLVYMDSDALQPRVRVYDTVAIKQEAYPNILGENPDLSPDGTLAAFQHDNRVWVFPLNATALVPVAEGSLPAWEPGG
jgi:hypothetical protein